MVAVVMGLKGGLGPHNKQSEDEDTGDIVCIQMLTQTFVYIYISGSIQAYIFVRRKTCTSVYINRRTGTR